MPGGLITGIQYPKKTTAHGRNTKASQAQHELLPEAGAIRHVVQTFSSQSDKLQNDRLKSFLAECPEIGDLDSSVRKPVVYGGDCLARMGYTETEKIVLADFKKHVSDILQAHDHVYILYADELKCLLENPSCIKQMLRGYSNTKTISVFFRKSPDENITNYLHKNAKTLVWQQMPIDFKAGFREQLMTPPDTLLDPINRCVDITYDSVWFTLSEHFDEEQLAAAKTFTKEQEAGLKVILNKGMLSHNKGLVWIFEEARREILYHVFSITLKQYESSLGDPEDFYRLEYKQTLDKFGINAGRISHFSPYLHRQLSANKSYHKLK